MLDLRPSLTPYGYCVNNPLLFVDPAGLIEYRFNQNGEYIQQYDDGKDEVIGVVYSYENGNMGNVLNRFTFNELTDQDLHAFDIANALIETGISSGLFVDLNFADRIANAGLDGDPNKGEIGKYLYALSESQRNGNMDYYASHLQDNYAFYLAGNTAYNPMDAGNFLWGVGMSSLGFEYSTVKIGSEVNAFFNAKSQNGQGRGITWEGDSAVDQNAIRKGFFWNKIWGK